MTLSTVVNRSLFRTPVVLPIGLLLVMLVVIAPWGEFPINDDWHFAHIAKNFAEHGILAIDLPSSTTIVGQAILAWPLIHFFGFSFLKLRMLTIAFSILILFEVDYLLRVGGTSKGVRAAALCLLTVNPFFVYFSTNFMTEHYAYAVALLAACVWFNGREKDSTPLIVVAAMIGGCAFWIRQLAGLVIPALVIAEFIVKEKLSRQRLVSTFGGIIAWLMIVAAFIPWSRATGSQTREASNALSRMRSPDPLILFFELGILVFYLTFFLVPFLLAWLRRDRVKLKVLLVPALLILSAAFAVYFGDSTGAPRSNIHRSFPFLHNVFNQYGIGPILMTDVYWENSGARPRVTAVPWVIIELCLIALSIAWAAFFGALKQSRNKVALFGVCFALLNYVAVSLSFETAIFDRYHYPAIIAFTIASAVVLPKGASKKFYEMATVFVLLEGTFTTLALHDHFRWQEAREYLAAEAELRGIKPSAVDAGYELNGWNDIEKLGVSPDCGSQVFWFCPDRQFRIGLSKRSSDRILATTAIRTWLFPFPPALLLQRSGT